MLWVNRANGTVRSTAAGRRLRASPAPVWFLASLKATAAHERSGELGGGERECPGPGPDLPIGRWLDGVAVLTAKQPAVLGYAEMLDVGGQHRHQFGRDRHVPGSPAGSGLAGTALEPAALVHPAVVGEILAGRGAGVREDQPSPALGGQVAAVPSERDDFARAHHRIEHAAVERHEPGPLAAADIAGHGEHVGHQVRAADRAGVDEIFWPGWRGPAFGQAGLAEGVAPQPLLADGIAEDAVHHPAAGEVVGGSGGSVQLAAEDVEQLADHGRVIQGTDGQRRPFKPAQGLFADRAGPRGVLILVE